MDNFQQLKDGVKCASLADTAYWAEQFLLSANSRDFSVALNGDLGTGKTTFVKALAKSLGITQTVKSPSFNICCIYDIPDGGKLVHIDAYRLSEPSQFDDLLIDEIAPSPRILCVEWAENVRGAFEPDYIFDLDIIDGTHTIKMR